MINIKELLATKEYDFLRENERLQNNVILLTLGGSYAYGTNNESSDVDVRGIALNSKTDLLGLSNFEQFIDNATDTTVYSFNKVMQLFLNCNPNVIEMLGCRPQDYFILDDKGKMLIDNRKIFLSLKCVNSFGGYAMQQLRRLENALARDSYCQAKKEEHIMMSCKSSMLSFNERFQEFPEGGIKIYTGKSERGDFDEEIFLDVHLEKYPLRDFRGMMIDFTNIVKDYDKLNKRNSKKDVPHLNKHAMHLVRLYAMCLDILEKEEIVTYREKDHDFLMSIRNGEFMKEDGTFRSEFFDIISEYEKKLEYAKANTSLPANPDYKKAEELMIAVNELVVK